MGTSLQVQPFASLIRYPPAGTPRLLINREKVGEHPGGFNFNNRSTQDVALLGDCDAGCMKLAEALGWDEDLKQLQRAAELEVKRSISESSL